MMSPANRDHVRLQVWLVSVLEGFVGARGLGEVLGPEFTTVSGSKRPGYGPPPARLCSTRSGNWA